MVVVAILAIGPASDVAVATGQSARWVRSLPRLDLDDGVPSELRTLVAVPMLLTSTADVEEQVAGLEVHYLGNREGDLRFALLSDGSMPTATPTPTTSCSPWQRPASIDSTNGTAMRRAAERASCSSTGAGCGTQARTAGWVGSASAASSRS